MGQRRHKTKNILAACATATALTWLVGVAAETHAQRPGPPAQKTENGAFQGRPLPAAQATNLWAAQKNLRARAPSTLPTATRRAMNAITLQPYLDRMTAAWRAADKNADWSLQWQGSSPAEPLPPAIANCAVVQYQFQPAKNEKDPTKPGVWINTPAQYTPNGWSTYGELLATTVVNSNQCEAYGLVVTPACVINNVKVLFGEVPTGSSVLQKYGWGSCNTYFGSGNPNCSTNSFSAWCQAKGGQLIESTSVTGCERFVKLGPDSLEAFLDVVKLNFASEDHNNDGVVSPSENQNLCLP